MVVGRRTRSVVYEPVNVADNDNRHVLLFNVMVDGEKVELPIGLYRHPDGREPCDTVEVPIWLTIWHIYMQGQERSYIVHFGDDAKAIRWTLLDEDVDDTGQPCVV